MLTDTQSDSTASTNPSSIDEKVDLFKFASEVLKIGTPEGPKPETPPSAPVIVNTKHPTPKPLWEYKPSAQTAEAEQISRKARGEENKRWFRVPKRRREVFCVNHIRAYYMIQGDLKDEAGESIEAKTIRLA